MRDFSIPTLGRMGRSRGGWARFGLLGADGGSGGGGGGVTHFDAFAGQAVNNHPAGWSEVITTSPDYTVEEHETFPSRRHVTTGGAFALSGLAKDSIPEYLDGQVSALIHNDTVNSGVQFGVIGRGSAMASQSNFTGYTLDLLYQNTLQIRRAEASSAAQVASVEYTFGFSFARHMAFVLDIKDQGDGTALLMGKVWMPLDPADPYADAPTTGGPDDDGWTIKYVDANPLPAGKWFPHNSIAYGTKSYACVGWCIGNGDAPLTGEFTPIVEVGLDAYAILGTEFSRVATYFDPYGAADPASVAWVVESGPAQVGETIGTALTLAWTPETEGDYVLRCDATDSDGEVGSDSLALGVGGPKDALAYSTELVTSAQGAIGYASEHIAPSLDASGYAVETIE